MNSTDADAREQRKETACPLNTKVTAASVLSASMSSPRRNLPIARTLLQKIKIAGAENNSRDREDRQSATRSVSTTAAHCRLSRTWRGNLRLSSRMTMSIGVKIACPVMTKPTARNIIWSILLVMDLNV